MIRSIFLVHQGLRWEEKALLAAARKHDVTVVPQDLSDPRWMQTPSVMQGSDFRSQCFLIRTPSYFHSLQISQWLTALGADVQNSAASLELFGQKIATFAWAAKFDLPVLPCVLGLSPAGVAEASECLTYPIVVKQNIGGFGRMVRLVQTPQQLRNDSELVFNYAPSSHRCLLIQPYLPLLRDIRLTVLNQKPLAVVQREAKDGDFRHNVAAGGTALALAPSAAVQELIEKVCAVIPRGFFGVDLFEGTGGEIYLNEINAVPLFHASAEASGIDIAENLILSVLSEDE